MKDVRRFLLGKLTKKHPDSFYTPTPLKDDPEIAYLLKHPHHPIEHKPRNYNLMVDRIKVIREYQADARLTVFFSDAYWLHVYLPHQSMWDEFLEQLNLLQENRVLFINEFHRTTGPLPSLEIFQLYLRLRYPMSRNRRFDLQTLLLSHSEKEQENFKLRSYQNPPPPHQYHIPNFDERWKESHLVESRSPRLSTIATFSPRGDFLRYGR